MDCCLPHCFGSHDIPHCFGGHDILGLVRRCSRLHTLVLVLYDYGQCAWPNDEIVALIARLPALVLGAPALRALQLVLPMVPGVTVDAAEDGLPPLWSALEALPHVASLALGWALTPRDHEEQTLPMGARIAGVLDAAQVGPCGLQALAHDKRGSTGLQQGIPDGKGVQDSRSPTSFTRT